MGGAILPIMVDPLQSGLLLAGLVDATALYVLLMSRRRHARRVEKRLHQSAHLYGLVRVAVADRRPA